MEILADIDAWLKARLHVSFLEAGTTEDWECAAEARFGKRDAMMHAVAGSMMPDLAQPAGLTDQERMANLIRQCMAPLPSVRRNRLTRTCMAEPITWC